MDDVDANDVARREREDLNDVARACTRAVEPHAIVHDGYGADRHEMLNDRPDSWVSREVLAAVPSRPESRSSLPTQTSTVSDTAWTYRPASLAFTAAMIDSTTRRCRALSSLSVNGIG